MRRLGWVALVVALVGCQLADDPSRHRCAIDDDCVAGRVCRGGVCAAAGPADGGPSDGADAASTSADAAGDDAVEDAAVDVTSPDAGDDGSLVANGCGNGMREGDEACDDAALVARGLCTRDCRWTHPPRITAGQATTCLCTGDGRLTCWGALIPALFAPHPARARAVAFDLRYAMCAVLETGALSCWGDVESSWDVPQGRFIDVSLGEGTGCGVREDGALLCWGTSLAGQSPPSGRFRQVALSRAHACALRTDGGIACWGSDGAGESSPPAGSFQALAVTNRASCGVTAAGDLTCWGELTVAHPGPFRAVSVGQNQVCALGAAGAISCWDRLGSTLPAPPDRFTAIAVGPAHACAVRIDNGVTCWGNNDSLQTGLPRGPYRSVADSCGVRETGQLVCWGPDIDPSLPQERMAEIGFAITGGGCFRREDGTIGCWGHLEADQPPGKFLSLSFPCPLRDDGKVICIEDRLQAPGETFRQVSGDPSRFTACGVRMDGTIGCWAVSGSMPLPPAGVFDEVRVSGRSVCALRSDGTPSCTMCPGLDPCEPVPPTMVPPGPFTALSVAQGGTCACGLRQDHRVQCWNLGTDGAPCDHWGDDQHDIVRLWGVCFENARGALVCPGLSIDLDDP